MPVGGSVVKNLPASSGDTGDVDLIPGLVRSLEEELSSHSLVFLPGEFHGPGRGAWWATVHGVAKSWTQLSTHSVSKHFVT